MSGECHQSLVATAAKWLGKKCAVVVTDLVTSAGETPDAMGWSSFQSILVECKASRSDFKADARKHFRIRDEGMGNLRYYMTPEGLIQPAELPAGWGLLEVAPNGKVRVGQEAQIKPAMKDWEVIVLLSALRRVGQSAPAGISVKCYTIETKRTATIGIAPPPPDGGRP